MLQSIDAYAAEFKRTPEQILTDRDLLAVLVGYQILFSSETEYRIFSPRVFESTSFPQGNTTYPTALIGHNINVIKKGNKVTIQDEQVCYASSHGALLGTGMFGRMLLPVAVQHGGHLMG